ncbi:MAG TPA: NAD(P)-binding domain-containing protein [Acidobacteriota bacterium]|nr:NAD(P)-binding domain-containing protein [Acidobacteriota bacterium]
MRTALARYASWLHLRWPAGGVEALPEVREDGSTAVPGLFIAGDLTGIPLLKLALDTGARAVERIARDLPAARGSDAPLDLVIVGAGVSGMAAAMEANARGLRFEVLEAAEPFVTIANFPRRKPIYTYPHAMTPAGRLQVSADVKESLLEELRRQADASGIRVTLRRAERIERAGDALLVHAAGGAPLRARRVLVAIGRSGDFRRLGVPGEERDKVVNRLHDPADFRGKDVLVVGGGDSAVEAAVALAGAGARTTLAHRGAELSRPKPENLERLGAAGPALRVRLGTRVKAIEERSALLLDAEGREESVPNDAVFALIGREAPLEFLRRSGVRIAGEMRAGGWIAMSLFVLFCVWLYNWKSGGSAAAWWAARHWFPFNLPELLAAAGGSIAASAADPSTLLGTLAISAAGPAFWYTLAYSAVVTVFGVRRIRRRRTPYITAQTITLMAVQVVPLFLLPEVILPLLGRHGLLPAGIADALFPSVDYGHGREYWRAYGLILAWPLNVYNVFTHEPLGWWLAISAVQTLVLIPLGIYFWGKGVYCGWICSCGALAETLGDTHRHKMPHGPGWNRLNLAGQAILAVALLGLLLRIAGWLLPEGNSVDALFDPWLKTPYKWIVDVTLAGVVGYGVYFWYSGRFWCRFLCPLAALMHVYARFSRFAIVAEKKKCISCNVCTSVCHQGIDVMSFANKGAPMTDPECVRCSACVQSCPTGVLAFGQVAKDGRTIALDLLPASPVRMREGD